MQAIHMKTNHLTAPRGIDAGPLFLSWQCSGGVYQTAYEIELDADGETVWQSGKVSSDSMHAEAPAVNGSRVRGRWRVRLWDENNVPGAWNEAVFETGLSRSDWQGVWACPETEDEDISGDDAINAFARPNWERKQAEQEVSGKGAARPYQPHRPASYLRRVFTAPAGSARLYITAMGLYAAWLNGVRVGDMVLAPGSFTGDKHLGVQTYDVTGLMRAGENELLIALGDGWHRSTSGVDGCRNLFGDTLGVLFQLEVDGRAVCVSDGAMQATQKGPIRQNDLQQGEVYDARLEGELTGWHSVKTAANTLLLTGMNTVPIREQEAFPGRLFTAPNGETVVDFGQNLAGYVEMTLTAHAGQKVKLTCGETLDENGNFTQENFQDRARHSEGGTAQLLELICKEGANHFKPSFTIMGFRYAKVETDADLSGAVFTAHAVYSDMAVTGEFTCGSSAVNQLVQNSIWSQKGNFCDIPTDCPTRERAGWTGDMGVFIDTGLTLMDCYPVVEKWLEECRLNQYPDGRMANIAPPNGRPSFMTPMLCMSAGWGDAAILVPFALYRRTGDRKILADNYEMMQKWYAFLLGRAQQTTDEQQTGEYAKYTVLNGLDYGEWCEPGVTPQQAMMNPRKSVGTAYLAYSGRVLAQVADALGKAEDAARYRDIADKAKKAYRAAFTENGAIHSDRQCEYVRAIQFALLDEGESQAAADALNALVAQNGCHLNTGFLSTPFLCGVLARYGHVDTAYRLLLQPEAPGWLYAVSKGATTVWETWTGIDDAGCPHDSLNHYSYGAICGWLFGGVCGIRLAGGALTIAPTPHKSLGHAKAVYRSPVGTIESGWRYDGDTVVYTFTIPANMTANVTLPDGRKLLLQPGTHTV
ncbi:hypothetical protein HMPREF1032_03522 [Subdoligranulum sp. 4_3_54A2FAA]|nr:hypothetical protein HMPREF1032_03522 [Subdoligranulum sp. 4_3_54A2FAA]MBS5227377.1 family 78 glycoside hydrolase catalytic domain [Subdoligranulum sp.]